MASIVQELLEAEDSGFIGGITASGSVTVTLGNKIYVLVGVPTTANTMVCTDNLGNTYTEIFELDFGVLSNTEQHLFVADIENAGTLTTIAADWSSLATQASLCSVEVEGAAVAGTPDINGGSGVTSLGIDVGGGGVTGFLLLGLCVFGDSGAITPPSGYSVAAEHIGSSGEISVGLYAKDGTSIGTLTTSWTNAHEATVTHIAVSLEATPPTLPAGISMDGVTIR